MGTGLCGSIHCDAGRVLTTRNAPFGPFLPDPKLHFTAPAIQSVAQPHTFVVFKTSSCPYCHQALEFLTALAKERKDIRIGTVDAHGQPDEYAKVRAYTRWNTVPQIFLDGRFIGGWSELALIAKRGRLDAYLDGEEWQEPVRKEHRWWPFGRKRSGDASSEA